DIGRAAAAAARQTTAATALGLARTRAPRRLEAARAWRGGGAHRLNAGKSASSCGALQLNLRRVAPAGAVRGGAGPDADALPRACLVLRQRSAVLVAGGTPARRTAAVAQ